MEDVLDGGLVGWTKCEVLGMRLGLLFWDWTCSSYGLCGWDEGVFLGTRMDDWLLWWGLWKGSFEWTWGLCIMKYGLTFMG